tara:strand:- start:1751 stop:2158 length:408 start_codon:yes stop_codon:yes gene_type:complete
MMTLIWNPDDFDRAGRQMRLAQQKAVVRIANETARRSRELVPFDTGNLSGSRVVKYPRKASLKIEASIAYGGTAAPYAVVQHENESLYHPAKARGGTSPVTAGAGRGPKYLEYPMKALFKIMPRVLKEEIKKFVK